MLSTLGSKANVLFIAHSPLSSFLNGHCGLPESLLWVDQIRSVMKASILLCDCPETIVLRRLAGKVWFAPDDEKAVRRLLGHECPEFVQKAAGRFQELRESGTVDGLIQTTSTRQAVPQLLRILGIEFDGGPLARTS